MIFLLRGRWTAGTGVKEGSSESARGSPTRYGSCECQGECPGCMWWTGSVKVVRCTVNRETSVVENGVLSQKVDSATKNV